MTADRFDLAAPSGLTRTGFAGIWAGLPTPWDEHGELDADAFAESVATMARCGAHGVYTTGSTGEFYAVEDREFERLMRALDEGRREGQRRTGRRLPTQAGISWLDTRGVLRRAEIAVRHGADAFQVALPSWFALGDEEVVTFVRAIAAAFPGIPIVHYNVARAGRMLDGALYRRLANEVPELIGAKVTGSDDALWAGLRREAPDLSFLVGETLLPRRMADGARGSCSSYIYIAPGPMLRLYAACLEGDGAEAARILARFDAFESDAVIPLVDAGYVDAAIDKALAEAAGWIRCSRRVREPYRSVTERELDSLRGALRTRYADLLEPVPDPLVAAPPSRVGT